MMPEIKLTCPGCERSLDPALGVFACPGAKPGQEHFLGKRIKSKKGAEAAVGRAILRRWSRGETHSFEIFRDLMVSRHLIGDQSYLNLVRQTENRLASHEGQGFVVTPLTSARRLRQALNRSGHIWIKDETGNVTGSHKGRHLMGTLLYLESLRARAADTSRKVLAIYSCGNAALGAAAVARAGGYELHAFVPLDIHPAVDSALRRQGAIVEKMPRNPAAPGDPCYLAFRRAVDGRGWIPFSCSGRDNWSNIEGGQTLGWETVVQLGEKSAAPSALIIQTGGGALGRAIVQAWEEMHRLGLAGPLPRVYVCQPEGGFPFVRAYYRVLQAVAAENGLAFEASYRRKEDPLGQIAALKDFAQTHVDPVREVAEFVRDHFSSDNVQKQLAAALNHRERFMWAWDGLEPASLAHGILDDETYDWYDLLMAVLKSGGKAEILREETIAAAHGMARAHTGIHPCPTGSAGLAGLMQLTDSGQIDRAENVGLFFTGIQR